MTAITSIETIWEYASALSLGTKRNCMELARSVVDEEQLGAGLSAVFEPQRTQKQVLDEGAFRLAAQLRLDHAQSAGDYPQMRSHSSLAILS